MPTAYPITAYCAVNGLGDVTEAVLQRYFAGESGLTKAYPDFAVETYCGAVPGELPPLTGELARFDSRQGRMCAHAVRELGAGVARARDRWTKRRVALVLGTSTGGIADSERAWQSVADSGRLPAEYTVPDRHALNASLELLRHVLDIDGPAYVVSTACSSSGKVFASAKRLLDLGLADAVVCGGVDTLCKLTVRGFASLEVVSAERCRPFAQARSGINIGEGGAFVLVEREGDSATALYGVGESSDAHHMTSPHPEGAGAYLAMRRALEMADLESNLVDHVNAHATGTVQNDLAESRGIEQLFGRETWVTGTKGYTGHLLGAAGATEAVFTIAALERGRMPASLGAEPVDAAIHVRVATEARATEGRFALSNSLAFGGSNVSVLFGVRA